MALRSRNVFTKMFISKQVKESIAEQNARLLLQAQNDLNSLAGQFEAGREGSVRQLEWYEQEQLREEQRSYASHQQEQNHSQQPPPYSAPQSHQYPDQQRYPTHQNTQNPPMVYVISEETREEDGNQCVIS